MSVFDIFSRRRSQENGIASIWGQAARKGRITQSGRKRGLATLVAAAGIIGAVSTACSGSPAPEATSQPTPMPKTEAATPSSSPTAIATREAAQQDPSPVPSLTLPAQQRTATPSPAPPGPVVSDPAPASAATAIAGTTPATATPTALAPRVAPAATPTTSPRTSTSNQKEQSLTTSHRVEQWAEFAQGQIGEGVTVSGGALRLADRPAGQQFTGEFLSQVWETEFPFNDAVLSWNAEAGEGTSVRFELRVRSGDQWSGWYGMGEWSYQGGRSLGGPTDALGSVDIDTLKLKRPANALQYRVKLTSSGLGRTPLVRQVAVVYADLARGLSGPQLTRPAGGTRDLDVPQRSQLDENPAVARTICSPTSLAMVMQYWGLKKSVAEVYAGVRDRTTGIYGNWPLNTAFAGANGFQARVDRFYSVVQLEQEIAAGRPVVVSVAYKAGELAGAAAPSTDGHLIVVRGFTANGDVIVNDPIASSSRSVRLVYNRDQFQKVWLRSGGVVYLVHPTA